MSDSWDIAKENFTEDDGALPGIALNNLNPYSVRAIFDFLRNVGTFDPQGPTLYDKARQQDVLISELDDPVGMVLDETADPFHCCFQEILFEGVRIPDLGLFVFRDTAQIDYRMGTDWNRENVNAFFRLLAALKRMTPEATVDSAAPEGVIYPATFLQALEQCLAE